MNFRKRSAPPAIADPPHVISAITPARGSGRSPIITTSLAKRACASPSVGARYVVRNQTREHSSQFPLLHELIEGIWWVNEFKPFTIAQAIKDVLGQRPKGVKVQVSNKRNLTFRVPVPDANSSKSAIDANRPNIEMCDAIPKQPGKGSSGPSDRSLQSYRRERKG